MRVNRVSEKEQGPRGCVVQSSPESVHPVMISGSHGVESGFEGVRGSSQGFEGVRGYSQGLSESKGQGRI